MSHRRHGGTSQDPPNNLVYAEKLIRMNDKSQIYIFETIVIREKLRLFFVCSFIV